MSRSIWKGPFCEIKLPHLKNGTLLDPPFLAPNLKVKVWSRRSIILPLHLGKNFEIYNGKRFVGLKVSEEMIGHKFGEFALTRRRPIHKVNKIRQTVKKRK